MGMLLTQLLKPRNLKVLVLGLDAAGKTTLIYRIKDGKSLTGSIPTIGFNREEVQIKGVNFILWDIGGQDKVQAMWKHYYYDVKTLVFVVDSSDRERMLEARLALEGILLDPAMGTCTILVYANKQDIEGAMQTQEVAQKLGLMESSRKNWYIQPSCALTGDGLFEGLQWVLKEEKMIRKRNKHKKKNSSDINAMIMHLRPHTR